MTDYAKTDRLICGDAYTSFAAMENLSVLCDEFGSRFAGTPGEKQAADYMAAKLREYELSNVRLEPFQYTGWQRGSASLEIISPIQKSIDCISLPHSPAAEVTAELYDAGDGAPSEFETNAEAMQGKIVMATSVTFPPGSKRWVHRGEKYGRSMLSGAKAFIFMNHYPAYGPATGGVGHQGKTALMPAVSVAYEDGAFLQRLVKKHGSVTLKLTTTDQSAPATSWNVLADLPGQGDPDTVIMLGSHYDGHDISQGAQDPASGAVAVLEAARLLATHAAPLPVTLRFALWGAEEIGLLGSKAYADAHAAELDKLRFYFNMDGAGSVQRKGVVLNEWPELETLVKSWQPTLAYQFATAQSVNAFSDHYPFLLKGVPTGGMESVPERQEGRGYGHTRYDTLDKVSLRELQDAAVLASLLAVRFATIPAADWPVRRRSEADVKALLNRPEYTETATIGRRVAEFYQHKG